MVEREYDRIILKHYREVAEQSGADQTSTMLDERTRQLETELIGDFVARAVRRKIAAGKREEQIQLIDVGCGNGYTLEVLSKSFPKLRCAGFEYTPELRKIAMERFSGGRVQIFAADIRQPNFANGLKADIVVCQRVLINLLDPADQVTGLKHILESTTPSSCLLFIEAFQSGLDHLNEARAEFDLSPLTAAHHNLYLSDQFFSTRGELRPFQDEIGKIPTNFLSTHYFVSRVFYPLLLGNRALKRNSHWATFFSQALPPHVGDYSQLRACAFET